MILPDVLAPGLKIVFCGSAPGEASARMACYYAKPGNKFWPILREIGLVPADFAKEDFRDLPKHGIGLTDIVKTAFGQDDTLKPEDVDAHGLHRKVQRYAPQVLAFTSKRSAQMYLGRAKVDYGLQPETIGTTKIVVLPSTSGLASKSWDPSWWHALVKQKK